MLYSNQYNPKTKNGFLRADYLAFVAVALQTTLFWLRRLKKAGTIKNQWK